MREGGRGASVGAAGRGWFLGGGGREGNGLGFVSRRGGGGTATTTTTAMSRIEEAEGCGGVRGERSLRRRYYSQPEDYQYP